MNGQIAPRAHQLRFPNLFRYNLHGRHRVASVHDTLRPVGEFLIINARVCRFP